MKHHTITIASLTGKGAAVARNLRDYLSGEPGCRVEIISAREGEGLLKVPSIAGHVRQEFMNRDAFIFIGSLGICVRAIAPVIGDKRCDPAVVNCDENGLFVQPVLSGHRGGANDLALRLSRHLGAQPVVTTSSDVQGLWPLDILGRQEGWSVEPWGSRSMTFMMADYVNHARTALLLDVRDRVTEMLERTKPEFVDIYYDYRAIPFDSYALLLAVTHRRYEPPVPAVFYRPKVLCVGLGCEKNIDPRGFIDAFEAGFLQLGLSPLSIRSLGSIDLKADEPAFVELSGKLQIPFHCFSAEDLGRVDGVPNPSATVMRKIGVPSVAEAASALLAGSAGWIAEKRKCAIPGAAAGSPRFFTMAVSLAAGAAREGLIAIVGAGPGDPELITLRGRRFLEKADLILYAGSLVPEKLTHAARPGALVRSSAGMALEEQLELMNRFYRSGRFVVRLHTGDPSIYGAIQEQMAWFEEHDMRYEIVPGVSSFQAAAAALHAEFTIPETVQTIILTRAAGRTPVPEKERLCELARSQSTMCIYLSAGIAASVQDELLRHYSPDTPVAVCYRLTWDDEHILRGELSRLAELVGMTGKSNTVLLVVGAALGARGKRSKLYDPAFAHGFRDSAGEAVRA